MGRNPKRHFLLPLAFWVRRRLKRHCFSSGYVLDKPKSAVSTWNCSLFGEVGLGMVEMEDFVEKSGNVSFTDSSVAEESSSSEESRIDEVALGWPMGKSKISEIGGDENAHKVDDQKTKQQSVSDVETMKERFSKLLLGEDMSGCGKGVCAALAISNAITNLCATLFGQLWRLEPLSQEKKSMWRREMECLLCVSEHIVELMPTWQTFPDGSKLEVMTCKLRSDLYINLPALKKLDNMLLEILDSFKESEFWYVDQGIVTADCDGSASFRRPLQRQEEKWWLPVPRVPPGGLLEKTKKQLLHKRDCTNQILKAAMAINSNSLAEMEVPESYIDSLPKNGRASLGDVIHRYITSDQFSPDCLLDCLEFSSEHQALEVANRVEASIYVWQRKYGAKPMSNADRREVFADRAESLLICLKQRFPGLTQTTLDICKIQCNKDVGKSILESYSRVLESLAFNIVARIDDVLYVDDLTTNSDQSTSVPRASIVAHKRVTIPYSVPISSIPYGTPIVEKSPVISRKAHSHGFSVKRVLTSYLNREAKGRDGSNVF